MQSEDVSQDGELEDMACEVYISLNWNTIKYSTDLCLDFVLLNPYYVFYIANTWYPTTITEPRFSCAPVYDTDDGKVGSNQPPWRKEK